MLENSKFCVENENAGIMRLSGDALMSDFQSHFVSMPRFTH